MCLQLWLWTAKQAIPGGEGLIRVHAAKTKKYALIAQASSKPHNHLNLNQPITAFFKIKLRFSFNTCL
jgi:hypothetical protein